MTRVVIGCGNPLAGDDGVGLKVIELLESRGVPPDVKTIAAGLPGLVLLKILRGSSEAIIVDAVDAGRTPGTIICCEEKDLALLGWRSLSSHSLGIGETLALGRVADPANFPQRLIFIGIQIGSIIPGKTQLSPAVEAAVPLAVKTVYRLLGEGGHA